MWHNRELKPLVWSIAILCLLALAPRIQVYSQPPAPITPDRSVGVLSEDPGYGERWSTTIFPFGNYTGTVSGEAVFCRTYLHFPVETRPGALVPNATLYVYVDDFWPGPGGAPMSVYPVEEDWTVEGVDWTDMANWPALGAPVATTLVTSDGEWFSWDVRGLVEEWVSGARPNYGLALAAAELSAVTDNWAAARRLTANSPETRPRLEYSLEMPTTVTIAPTPTPQVPQAPASSPVSPSPTPTPIPVLLPETGSSGAFRGEMVLLAGLTLAASGVVFLLAGRWLLRRHR